MADLERDLDTSTVRSLTGLIAQEIANALGLPREGAHMSLLSPFVRAVTGRFAALVAAFDADVGAGGFRTAAQRFVTHFVERYDATGVDRVPASGPLIIAANHPGVSDAVVLASALPRDDARLVISDVPLVRALPHMSGAFIPVSGDPDDHVWALRQIVAHLEAGGAVIIFPGTYLTPDPALVVGGASERDGALASLARATFEGWSSSILLALRRVDGCRLVPAVVSGVTAPRFARHPLTRLIRAPRGWERQRMAEILQVMAQIRRENHLGLAPRVTFGDPIAVADLGGVRDREAAMAAIRARAVALLAESVGD